MKSGAQPGNNNAGKSKPWRDALDKAIKQYVSKPDKIERGQALFKIATKVVEDALRGNVQAIQEIGNRLDGKPHQSMDIGLHDDKPLEEMNLAELGAELATVRKLVAAHDKPRKRAKKPARVLN